MTDFFRKELEADAGIPLFGWEHLCITAVFAAAWILLFLFRGKLRRFGHFGELRLAMAWILLLNMLIHYASRIMIGEWSVSEDLPFHLCFVTNFFMIYVLFTDNRRGLFRVVYYFTLIGPLPAIIWPDLHRGAGGWVFYQFIISHHLMLLFSMYCLYVLEYKTSAKSALAAFFIGNAYVGLMAVFNHYANTNYVMLTELPARLYEVYPFLNKMPAFFWLESVGILALLAAYAPALSVNRRKTAPQPKSP